LIYAPAFHGEHRYSRYDRLKKEMEDLPDVIDVDFLFPNEIQIFMENIFWPIYYEHQKQITFQSKDKKVIRKIRASLKKGIIPYGKVYKYCTKFRMNCG